jgi:ketosteroid isomerase-like protein
MKNDELEILATATYFSQFDKEDIERYPEWIGFVKGTLGMDHAMKYFSTSGMHMEMLMRDFLRRSAIKEIPIQRIPIINYVLQLSCHDINYEFQVEDVASGDLDDELADFAEDTEVKADRASLLSKIAAANEIASHVYKKRFIPTTDVTHAMKLVVHGFTYFMTDISVYNYIDTGEKHKVCFLVKMVHREDDIMNAREYELLFSIEEIYMMYNIALN